MKKKMLLFGSFSAMLLGAVMIITPAKAGAALRCSSKHCEQNSGTLIIESCRAVVGGGCACPLPHPTFNGCLL